MWNHKQNARWVELMKFEPAETHLIVWAQKMKTQLKLQEYLDGLKMEKLLPVWQEGNKQKQAGKEAEKTSADKLLKAVWRKVMDFSPTAWHLGLLQKQIERDLGVDAYFQKVDVETLLAIVREVATAPAPTPEKAATTSPEAAQPKLNLAEAK